MKVAMIGTGYVGLVSGACFAEFGADVVCVDMDQKKIDLIHKGVMPIYEHGLEPLVKQNIEAGRLTFTTDIKKAVAGADIVFICVGTPTAESQRSADLQYVFRAAEDIADAMEGFTVVATKSTVPVGTGRRLQATIAKRNPKADFAMASNPEFLREGSAIQDFMHPDRVVVGVEDERAKKLMYDLYRPLSLNEVPVLYSDIETAEMIKYASNCFLATKIGFINEISDLCEKLGANVQHVARGMGMDGRIGAKFLHPSPGFGGSCFPKDTRALVHMAEAAGTPCDIVDTVLRKNERRKLDMVNKIADACGNKLDGKTLAILGLTFKPETDDMRESSSLVIVPELLNRGVKVRVTDPEGMENAKKYLSQKDIAWCKGAYEAMEGADAAVILTEWNEFRNLDLKKVKSLLKKPVLVDLRNVYKIADMKEHGFTYVSLGRKRVG